MVRFRHAARVPIVMATTGLCNACRRVRFSLSALCGFPQGEAAVFQTVRSQFDSGSPLRLLVGSTDRTSGRPRMPRSRTRWQGATRRCQCRSGGSDSRRPLSCRDSQGDRRWFATPATSVRFRLSTLRARPRGTGRRPSKPPERGSDSRRALHLPVWAEPSAALRRLLSPFDSAQGDRPERGLPPSWRIHAQVYETCSLGSTPSGGSAGQPERAARSHKPSHVGATPTPATAACLEQGCSHKATVRVRFTVLRLDSMPRSGWYPARPPQG